MHCRGKRPILLLLQVVALLALLASADVKQAEAPRAAPGRSAEATQEAYYL